MKQRAVFVLVLTMVAILAGGSALAEQHLIRDVLEHPTDFANKKVFLAGVVSNSEVVTPDLTWEIQIKGRYDLTDRTGTIQVRTTSDPPPNNKRIKVTGTVDTSEGTPFLLQTGGLGGLPGGPVLWVALGVLVVLAIVLVILLTRQPKKRAAEPVPSGGTVPAGVPPIVSRTPSAPAPSVSAAPAPKTCPKCGATNDGDANFCESCREPLPPTSTSKPTVAPSGRERKPSERPTVGVTTGSEELPLADLTVIEGEGAPRGTKFSLKKERQKIGRRDDMDIRLNDETVSREHASIWWEDGSFYVQDEASSSGTLVNGKKVTRQSLNDNDEILLGKTKLIFRMIGK